MKDLEKAAFLHSKAYLPLNQLLQLPSCQEAVVKGQIQHCECALPSLECTHSRCCLASAGVYQVLVASCTKDRLTTTFGRLERKLVRQKGRGEANLRPSPFVLFEPGTFKSRYCTARSAPTPATRCSNFGCRNGTVWQSVGGELRIRFCPYDVASARTLAVCL